MIEHIGARHDHALDAERARRLDHVDRAHDVELDRRIGIALRAQGQHRVGGRVRDARDLVALQHRGQRQRAQDIAHLHDRARGIEQLGERRRLRRRVEQHGALALLDQNARDLRADQPGADDERRHGTLPLRANVLAEDRARQNRA
jgi:hypothetical protein